MARVCADGSSGGSALAVVRDLWVCRLVHLHAGVLVEGSGSVGAAGGLTELVLLADSATDDFCFYATVDRVLFRLIRVFFLSTQFDFLFMTDLAQQLSDLTAKLDRLAATVQALQEKQLQGESAAQASAMATGTMGAEWRIASSQCPLRHSWS